MAGEETVQLRDVCVKIGSGATPRGGKEAYKGGATSLIRSQNIYNEGFHRDGLVYIDDDQSAELRNVEVKPNDVLLNITGDSVARCCQVAADVLPARVNQHVAIIRPQSKSLDARFLRYVLVSHEYQSRLLALASAGATRPALTKSMIEELDIPSPPLSEQKAIAAVLGALDDKIELNRRMNATLEAIARTLFQSWFVDFDPVRANMDRSATGQPSPPAPLPLGEGGRRPGEGAAGLGRGSKVREKADLPSPHGRRAGDEGRFALDPATAALFPDSFQDSEAGHIPKGWTIQPVGEVVDCVGGGTPSTAEPKYWEGGTHHWTTPKDFSSLQAPVLLDTDRKLTDAGIAKISSGLLPAGTLLLSSRAPVGYLAIAAMPVAINQGFIALKCNERASNFFMLNWCQTNMAEIECRATGTTFAEISKQNFRPICVVLPPKELMAAFTAKVAPLYAQITANLHQSRTLATLRDTLLPKLLSGELSLPAALLAAQAGVAGGNYSALSNSSNRRETNP
jgi:type I restriction enzyme S subunit